MPHVQKPNRPPAESDEQLCAANQALVQNTSESCCDCLRACILKSALDLPVWPCAPGWLGECRQEDTRAGHAHRPEVGKPGGDCCSRSLHAGSCRAPGMCLHLPGQPALPDFAIGREAVPSHFFAFVPAASSCSESTHTSSLRVRFLRNIV